MSQSTSSSEITCPQCGGGSRPPSGQPLVTCPFCDSALYVDRSATVEHYSLPFLLDRAAAERSLKRWMASRETVRGLDEEARIDQLEALSFPMWLFRFASEGAAGGEEVVVEPAAPLPIPQIADLELPGGRLEPFGGVDDGVRAIAATVPLETAVTWLGERAGERRRSETALVEVPLWSCRYSYRGRSYRALIEGSSGAVMASVFPRKAESPFVLVAVAGLVLFGAEGLLIGDLLFKALAFAVTALPLTALAWWVARRV